VGIDVTSLYNRRADNRWDRCVVGDIFERVAAVRPDAEAIVGAFGAFADPANERLSYAEADALANRFAQALLARGVARGDRILMVCENSTEAFLAKIGMAKAGCVAVPVNPSQTTEVLIHAAELAEPVLVVADAECLELPRSAGIAVDVTIPIGGTQIEGITFAEFCASGSPEAPELTIHADDIWQILFTSGTTAMPKGVMVSHQYSYLVSLSWALSYTRGLDHESKLRMACFAPIIFHIGDQVYTMPALFTGGTMILGRRFKIAPLADTVADERATAVIGGGLELAKTLLTELEALGPEAASSLTCVMWGLGLADPETIERWERLCPGISLLYIAGQTESCTGHRFVVNTARDTYADAAARRVNLIGHPAPLMVSRVVDVEDGATSLPPGEIGELVYRSPIMASGYYRDEAATEKAFDGGWFHSGDLGSTEPGGERLMAGRIKEMIKTGGENVASARVESVVGQHPDVERVAVIGLPDERWGEAVTAVVVAAPGRVVEPEALIAFARERLAGYETPKRVAVVDELPVDFVGKVRKVELRRMMLERPW
jgi:acyl-CoA synthetase (AMP-forming)/AMP-acid ligase II